MQAKDVMTPEVAAVAPDVPVEDIARVLVERRISGVPVVDGEGRVIGMVSEGDLMRRPENATEPRPSWWLRMLAGSADLAAEYVKTRGLRAEQVMSDKVISVADDTPLGEIATLLERHRIKRVPVLQHGRLVGIVSRANLLQGLAAPNTRPPSPVAGSDRELRDRVVAALTELHWLSRGAPNVIVSDGVAELWGWVDSDREREAVQLAVERTPGVRGVENHVVSSPPFYST